MILRALIRKRDPGYDATAIPATPAIAPVFPVQTVAGIATVAVATPDAGQPFVKRPLLEEAANADSFAGSGRVTMASDTNSHQLPASIVDDVGRPSTDSEARVAENADSALVVDLWQLSEQGLERSAQFAVQTMDPGPDDRQYCAQCVNLRGRVCIVAKPGGVVSATVGYRPVTDLLHRCAGFVERPVRAVPISY